MSLQMKNAKALYLRGIRDGEVEEVLNNYMDDTYTQHSTGVKEGKAGFQAFFEDFFQRNPQRDIQIVRTLEDGPYVFLHVYQNLNEGEAQWVTADVFKANKEGRIIEHWDVIDAYAKSDVDPIFGDCIINDEEHTEDHKNLIRLFLTEVMQNHHFDCLDDYVSQDLFQHDASLGKTRKDWKTYLQDYQVTYDFVFKTLGQGNYVVTYSQVFADAVAYAYFDVFRLANGQIVEHYTNKEVVPDRQELTNYGKF